MARGDKKTKRGKINRGTYGVRRPRIKKKVRTEDKINIDKDATVKR
ncbi:30S ribosomal protein THX [Formosa sp. 3Alg 14/1]